MTTIAEPRSKTGKDISIGALANIVGLDPTTLNRNLNTLQRDKLVDVRPDKNDSARARRGADRRRPAAIKGRRAGVDAAYDGLVIDLV